MRSAALPYSEPFKDCAATMAQYTYDTFGTFPGTIPTLYILTYLQAHHIDLNFYDRFFNEEGGYLGVANFFGDRRSACTALTCDIGPSGGGSGNLDAAACRACRSRANERFETINNGFDECMETPGRQASQQCSVRQRTCDGLRLMDDRCVERPDLLKEEEGEPWMQCGRIAPDVKTTVCEGPGVRHCIKECRVGIPSSKRSREQSVGAGAFGLSGAGGLTESLTFPATAGFHQMRSSAQSDYLRQSGELLTNCLKQNQCF